MPSVPTIDPVEVGAVGVLDPGACREVATRAAALIDVAGLDRCGRGRGRAALETDGSEAWLNTWWQPRDSGFHDHGGSCGGVFVIAGEVTGEYLQVEGGRRVTRFGAGDSFSFDGRPDPPRRPPRGGRDGARLLAAADARSATTSSSTASCGARPGSPDEVSPPSHELTRALGCGR